MKISEQWLREVVNPRATTEKLSERLTLAGIEVSAIHDALPAFKNVFVGEVQSITPHPQTNKLTICKVQTGDGEPLQIVCGASNAYTGMKTAVVLPGGSLPDGTEIGVSNLRGVESRGMLCSAHELGLAEDHTGLMQLPADAVAGASLAEVLGGHGKILEIEITPNRGDCLSVLGIARELGALYDLDLRLPDCRPVKSQIKDTVAVHIEASAACRVFAGRVIRNLNPEAVTPLWMRERLRRAGLRSLHPVVDVTQYVMLELGQPMHAYDLKQLSGGIVVRMAKSGECMKLLDGNSHSLDTDILVIADRHRALGAGGIMGGSESSVRLGTTEIYLEAASFDPGAISSGARKLGLQTDAAYRFERGVDPSGQARALERATRLLQAIAGGQAGPVKLTKIPPPQRPAQPRLRRARLEQLLGITVPAREVHRILQRLGFKPKTVKDGWQVTVPSFRFDIEREEDLVEEVGRIYGYERVPAIHYPSAACMPPLSEERLPLSRLRDILVNRGYQEVITYSFVDGALQQRLTGGKGLTLANPITAEMTEMRRSLWPGLVQVLRYNLNRQQTRVRIFELGMIFDTQDNEIKQEKFIAGLISGLQYPLQWGLPQRAGDFADLRGDIDALLTATASANRLRTEARTHPALHPGQSARLFLEGDELGWMGGLHPGLARQLEVNQPVFLFELLLEPLLRGHLPRLLPVPQYPSLSRDLAVVVDEAVTSAAVLKVAQEVAIPVASEVRIFDIYRGPGIDSGRKSVALSLILQDSSRTLTDEAADAIIAKIARQLQFDLGATIRD